MVKFITSPVSPDKKILLVMPLPFWPKMPPLGIGYLEAFLADNNINCDILDLNNIFYNLTIEYKEVKISRILNPTGIDLGEYVINPFMGCEYSCLYCYVKSNKAISKRQGEWGKYVDIRINAPDLLEKEILAKKPKCVLLGSTTDCFQPIETKYMVTKRVLGILNKHKVYYHILTRSPNIAEHTDLLKQGFCKKIYFTINNITSELKNKLELKSPGFELRIKAINKMLDENIAVVPYFSPILPWISDFKDIFSRFPKSDSVEFEGLNMNLVNIKDIIREAIKAKKNYNICIHNFRSYFTNKYTPGGKRGK